MPPTTLIVMNALLNTTMNTDIYPYTAEAICDILQMDATELVRRTQTLGLIPQQDDMTGQLLYSLAQLESLRMAEPAEAIQPSHKLDSPAVLAPQASTGLHAEIKPTPALSQATPVAITPSAQPTLARASSALSRQSATTPELSRDQLSAIVDNVSNAKALILNDLAMLLDDKLSGLDDIVVELIRSKSQIDALKTQLNQMEARNTDLQTQLGQFKPTAFGFYRKSR